MKRRSGRSHALMRSPIPAAIAAAFGVAVAPLAASALELDWRLKATVAGVADGGRDLGLTGADDTHEAYVDATPWVHLQFSPEWAAFVRVRAYAPTGELLQAGDDDNNERASNDAFVGLREAWIEYGGLTSYPGEALRLGRQRIRNDDAQYFDQDIDAVRWIFNTTLIEADLGVARQLDSYRTDDLDIPSDQEDRTYGFAHLAWDWAAEQRFGVRAVHANDDNALPGVGEPIAVDARRTRGQQTWIGVYADNHAYDWKSLQPYWYWASLTYLTGTRYADIVDPATGTVSGREDENVNAWEGEAGLRMRVAGPVQAGVAYAHSGGDSSPGKQYEQNGLQSNYSRFTGTRTQVYRFNEAYRPELGNLQVATAFVSMNAGAWDGAVIYNKLRRPDRYAPIVSDGLRVAPTVADHDLGQGVDLILTRYFDIAGAGEAKAYTPDDTGDSSIRLRGSWFKPGDAYGDDAKDDYRVVLEFTLWY